MGKAKLAPVNGHTIPGLELCGAVLGVDIALGVSRHLGVPMTEIVYHTDSKIILRYISNNTKRFSTYITNHVAYVRKYSSPGQWHYISTDKNPADQATRPVAAHIMKDSPWLLGPIQDQSEDDLQTPDADVVTDKTPEEKVPGVKDKPTASINCLVSNRFERFSQWKNLVRAVLFLKNFVRSKVRNGKTDVICDGADPHELSSAETFIIKTVQGEAFREEIQCLKTKSSIAKNSPIIALSPFIDTHGTLRVGGRLRNSELAPCEKNPAIIPERHHIALLLVRHHHELSRHQGRHFTEGAVRASDLWIVSGKRLINSVLHKCVRCKMFRGKQEFQKMSDLPDDRSRQSPPFSYVGVDTFGPWEVVSRKTRGGQAHSKRWALLFTCLVTRAIHIEVIEEMSSSCFVNALHRVVAIHGNVKQFRSDRGTNFTGATEMLEVDTVHVEHTLIKDYLDGKRIKWIFNPPHSAHMGGAWERLIGVVKRILSNMTKDISPRTFTHEVLTTFMCEVCAIVNARPITPVSSDPDDPEILLPSTLLTLKTCHEVAPLQGCQGDIKDLYRKQWKQVQLLADTFWRRFRSHYLSTLQTRSKWTEDRPNIQQGDIVLLEENCNRNEWPMAIVIEDIKSDDGKVRKAVVKANRDGQPVNLTRPISELVVLLRTET